MARCFARAFFGLAFAGVAISGCEGAVGPGGPSGSDAADTAAGEARDASAARRDAPAAKDSGPRKPAEDAGSKPSADGPTSRRDTGQARDLGSAPDLPPPVPATFSARFQPGGLDRIFIRAADAANDRCFEIVLVTPPFDTGSKVMTPSTWGLQHVLAGTGAAGCLAAGPTAAVDTSGTTGSVIFAIPQGEFCPTSLGLDLEVPVVGGAAVLRASAISVSGCV